MNDNITKKELEALREIEKLVDGINKIPLSNSFVENTNFKIKDEKIVLEDKTINKELVLVDEADVFKRLEKMEVIYNLYNVLDNFNEVHLGKMFDSMNNDFKIEEEEDFLER